MKELSQIGDRDLLALMPSLVCDERARSADVIEHLVELDARRLYLDQACRSLSAYCVERLGYSEDEAGKRVRATRLARRFPSVLDELRSGAIHLSGLVLLTPYLTVENYSELLALARGQSKKAIERLLVSRFPKPALPEALLRLPEQQALAMSSSTTTFPTLGPGSLDCDKDPSRGVSSVPGPLRPLSASSWAVQFTASNELAGKIERARELTSHALPTGDLAALFERALDALIERETKRKLGAGKPRKPRLARRGSRHIPVEVARIVWERDGGQCTFVDEQGRRCSARHFVTLEHREPYALDGQATPDNLRLLCAPHNQHSARRVFDEVFIARKRAEGARLRREKRRLRETPPVPSNEHTSEEPSFPAEGRGEGHESHQRVSASRESMRQVAAALRNLSFAEPAISKALTELRERGFPEEPEGLLRAALRLLVPAVSPALVSALR